MYMASEWGLSHCDYNMCLDASKRAAEVSKNLDSIKVVLGLVITKS